VSLRCISFFSGFSRQEDACAAKRSKRTEGMDVRPEKKEIQRRDTREFLRLFSVEGG